MEKIGHMESYQGSRAFIPSTVRYTVPCRLEAVREVVLVDGIASYPEHTSRQAVASAPSAPHIGHISSNKLRLPAVEATVDFRPHGYSCDNEHVPSSRQRGRLSKGVPARPWNETLPRARTSTGCLRWAMGNSSSMTVTIIVAVPSCGEAIACRTAPSVRPGLDSTGGLTDLRGLCSCSGASSGGNVLLRAYSWCLPLVF